MHCSRNHTTLDPDGIDLEPFWNWSWEKAGEHDLPAAFDYIRGVSGQEKIFYLGHSMGSSAYLACMSLHPEQQDKLHAAFLMAPPAWFSHMEGDLVDIAGHWRQLENIFEAVNIWEVLKDTSVTSHVGHAYCDEAHLEENREKCIEMSDSFFMVSHDQLNETMLPVYFDVWPEGSSVKPLVHYGQLIANGVNFSRSVVYSRFISQ